MKKVVLICDICTPDEDHEATHNLKLRVGDLASELDVCETMYKTIREDWLPILRKGVTRNLNKKAKAAQSGKAPATIDAAQAAIIRAWCEKNNVDVNPRGRVSKAAVDAYNSFNAPK